MSFVSFFSLVIFLTFHVGVYAQTPQVFVGSIKKTKIYDELVYPVQVKALRKTVIKADMAGIVTKVHYHLGERVRRKKVLVEIKHTDPMFLGRKVGHKSFLSGMVTKSYVSVGAVVAKGSPLLEVIDPTELKGVFNIPIKDKKLLKRGEKGVLQFSSDKKISVSLVGVSPTVDWSLGVVPAEIKISLNQKSSVKKPELLLGKIGEVRFKVNEHKGILVPQSAILYRMKKTFLRLIKDKKMQKFPVTLGNKYHDQIEINGDLKEKDLFIVRSNQYIAEGEEVSIVTKDNGKDKKKKNAKNKTQVKKS